MSGVSLLLLLIPLAGGQNPDLTLSEFTVSNDCDTVFFDVVVENSGNGDAGYFSMALYFNTPNAPAFTQTPDAILQVDGLESGINVLRSTIWENAPMGEITSWVRLDDKQQVTEFFVDETGVNVGEKNNLDSAVMLVALNRTGCKCVDRELIMMPCTCGKNMAATGFCCGNHWQPDPCADLADPVATADQNGEESTENSSPDSQNTAGNNDDLPSDVRFGAPKEGWENQQNNESSNGQFHTTVIRRRSGCNSSPHHSTSNAWVLLSLLLFMLAARKNVHMMKRYASAKNSGA